ncbi:MAG: hypothetical protein IJD51_03835 [Clostridia bacterium]|nr:hypothetical protein [Clostridia bacterium]
MKRIVSFILSVCLLFGVLAALASCDGAVTTVSAEEWESALKRDNFTVSGYLTENGEQESLAFKAAEDVYYSENDGHSAWVIKQEEGWYMYPDGDVDGQWLPSFGATVGFTLISFRLPEFSAFTYDDKLSAYVTANEDNPAAYYEYRVYFSDGVITKFESLTADGTVTYSYSFSSYGTTNLAPPSELT